MIKRWKIEKESLRHKIIKPMYEYFWIIVSILR